MSYLFTNIIGVFVFDKNFRIVDKILFKTIGDYKNKEKSEGALKAKHRNLQEPDIAKALEFFRDKQYFNDFYTKNIQLTKEAIKKSVAADSLIIQTISNIEELAKTINLLVKRLREWYSLYNPEFSNSIQNHEKFVELILAKDKKTLLKEINASESMGSDLNKENIEPILSLARQIKSMYNLKQQQETYLNIIMKKTCPNMLEITGPQLGAKLVESAGSLERLTKFPASTIQLLGAEKALFRHMKNKKNLCPKYGILHEHPFITKVKNKNQGKAARTIADKLSIAVKVDYFKGNFIGDKLKQDIERRIKSLK